MSDQGLSHRETIFALSSGKGRGGVAVIRLSGPQVLSAIRALTGKEKPPVSRETRLCSFRDPETNHRLDRGLLLYFQGPKSFTGEDVAEFHIHGGRAVIAGFLDALSKIAGLRSALPGEFSRRAFDHGKMDLTAIEGLSDLINAETEAQKRQALRLMDGRLADLYEGWRKKLIAAMAYLEVDIDFADEEIPDDLMGQVMPVIEGLRDEIYRHLGDGFKGERIRDGLQLVILGEPNVGKSTLLNFLSRRDVAIISDIAGTTRDLLEVHLDINGFAVTIVDTAGLRDSQDAVEREGVRRAEQRAKEADIKVIMLEAKDWPDIPPRLRAQIGPQAMLLINKTDLSPLDPASLRRADIDCLDILAVSVREEQGLDLFIKSLSAQVERMMALDDTPNLTRQRHRESLIHALSHLERFQETPDKETALLAEDLRMAARDIGAITGLVDVEDLLDVIFSEFCIGK